MTFPQIMIVHVIARITPISVALALLLVGGCAGSPPREASAARPAPPAAARPFLVRYVDEGRSNLLSAEQIARIRNATSRAAATNGPVWFVLVLANDEGHCDAIVYFLPEKSTSRVRRVKCMKFCDFAAQPGKASAEPGECPAEIQIVPTGQAIAAGFEVPALADAPFAEPVDAEGRRLFASDDELARLVDFARSYLDKAAHCHIVRIATTREGFRVYAGWQTGIRSGGGTYLNVSRKNGEFYCPEDLHQDGQLGGVIGIWRS